ncbi:MAG: aminodeoxychorismate synthase component I [Proteobacteria bacterium]|nr:aminodeoxychorismate synthase component I [Pseudomonadota bacterium]
MNSTLLPAGVNLHALHRLAPARYSFLLQSTAAESSLGGFDLLLLSQGDALVLEGPGRLSGAAATGQREFITALDGWWQNERVDSCESEFPFSGGWFLFLGYELAAEIEPSVRFFNDTLLPTAFAVRCPAALVVAHKTGHCYFIAEPGTDYDIEMVNADIAAAHALADNTRTEKELRVEEEDPARFLHAVAAAKAYIASGEIYQANLSRGWSATAAGIDANQIYAALCKSNPGPFAGLIHWDGVSIVSSSPERLLHIRDGRIATRPIAGTRPRSDDAAYDRLLLDELLDDPKERAEHVMLIDLERNDLGRICEPGSVEVSEMMIVESYAHVHHIVSNVQGRLRPTVTPGAAIRALFPGGTITGCPKVRCMQIISELEAGPRGAYTGSFGYLNRDGSMDLNILIRTMVIRDDEVSWRAGSGIVADSDPATELNETRAKAKGLLRAIAP